VANIKSQKKRILTNEKRRVRNQSVKSELKTLVRQTREAAEAGAKDEGEGDDRVEAEACGERQGVVRDNTHKDRHDARDERGTGGDALGRDRTVFGDGLAKNLRVDDQDVGHREEGDNSTADFATDGRTALGNLEERIE